MDGYTIVETALTAKERKELKADQKKRLILFPTSLHFLRSLAANEF
jgi:hypothetical protein